jgi:hypothetical protein
MNDNVRVTHLLRSGTQRTACGKNIKRAHIALEYGDGLLTTTAVRRHVTCGPCKATIYFKTAGAATSAKRQNDGTDPDRPVPPYAGGLVS